MAQSKKQKISLFLLAAVMTVGAIGVPLVRATSVSDLQAQIGNLQSQNAQSKAAASQLANQAATYQDQINQLQSQINTIEQQISGNEAKRADIQNQIVEKQAEIDQNKQVLGDDLRTMYVDGQMTTVEMLATSNNLSDYVDKQEYRNVVQSKIQIALQTITALQQQLQGEKTQVEQLLSDEQSQQSQLSSARSQQNQLLAMNQQQQDAYNQQVKVNQAQIATLNQQIAAANASNSVRTLITGGACSPRPTNTYPDALCGAAQDSVTDQWGLLNRECVSYTAWMEASQGRYVPYGLGNAGDWPSRAASHGIKVDNVPEVGSVAIRPAFPDVYFGPEQDVGHAMYVEAINVDGDPNKIEVSEYNADLNGQYKEEVKYVASTYHGHNYQLQFIHFR